MYEIRSSRRPALDCPDFDAAYMAARARALRDRLQATIFRQTTRGASKPLYVLTPRAFGFEVQEYPWRADPDTLRGGSGGSSDQTRVDVSNKPVLISN